ncbi:MAG: glycoside hydrolase family 97 protein [Paludibacteraceae bacterium]|nr:glycoside hydrolase family 97 protein [Paludibacteraceae bacterium]
MFKKSVYLYICLMVALCVSCHRNATSVSSPDGQLKLSFDLIDGVPHYSVSRDGQPVLLPSPMGLTFVTNDGDTVSNCGWQLSQTESASVDETWETVWGEERLIRDYHNELTVHLSPLNTKLSSLNLSIVFRVFNDGFAFRYVFPEQEAKQLTVLDEHSSYVFAEEPQIWSIPWRTEYYEALFEKTPLHEKDTMNSPITLEMADGSYAFIHEAALTDYPCQNLYALNGSEASSQLSTFLTPWMKDDQVIEDKAYVTTPFATPWRFMILTRTLPEMVASRIMLNLNEPCKIEDTSWIRPMKFIGIWWGMHMREWTWRQGPNHGATTEHMKQYLDFAADNHIQGVLAEGWNLGWEGYEGINNDRFSFVTPYPDYDINFLSEYAKQRGVQIVCHHETSGRANEYEADLDTAYQYMQRYGMHAVKTGYVAPIITTNDGHQINRSQSGVRHYRKVIETAAKYQVMIDNHEPAMPTGLQRTWPNLMTQEGIRGQEWNAWSADGGSPCSHVCTLPFTRMMAGPADYTPGVFAFENPVIPGTRVHSTLCNQLALFVVLYSPLQMACDKIENYQKHPAEFQFIKDVPCDWEQSRLLDGQIGEYVVMARQERGGNDWYLGAITNETARDITIDLSFLGEGEYEAQIYRDGDDAEWQERPYSTNIETRVVTANDQPMTIRLASGGGCAIRFKKL